MYTELHKTFQKKINSKCLLKYMEADLQKRGAMFL